MYVCMYVLKTLALADFRTRHVYINHWRQHSLKNGTAEEVLTLEDESRAPVKYLDLKSEAILTCKFCTHLTVYFCVAILLHTIEFG